LRVEPNGEILRPKTDDAADPDAQRPGPFTAITLVVQRAGRDTEKVGDLGDRQKAFHRVH
jgi:hypothetical protein